jgi:uncharacterized protein
MMAVIPAPRDEAIDVARAFAILGMFVIHAVLVLGTSVPSGGMTGVVVWMCDGRAAATFVTLAGFGVARLAAKQSGSDMTRTFWRRALVLWTLGVLNLVFWPGDILRVYGVALLLAPVMLRWTARTRVAVAIGLAAVYPLLMLAFDWTTHWQLDTLTYVGVWTPQGFVRNLLYDGFRPVVPWLGFFLLGTVLAEQDLRDPKLWRRLIVGGALTTMESVELSSWLDGWLARAYPSLDALTREGLVGTLSLPPLPLSLLSEVGTTALVIGTALALVPRLPRVVVEPLVATGRRALTWYLWHVAVLMTLYAMGAKQQLAPASAIVVGVLLWGWALVWSHCQRERIGVMERFMRWAARSRCILRSCSRMNPPATSTPPAPTSCLPCCARRTPSKGRRS